MVIGDGGDFVSFAGKYAEPAQPGHWLDPGPFGCLGTGLGYAIAARLARPSAQVLLLLGDGAAASDGRRHARPAQPAGRDGVRQQRRLGAGKASDARPYGYDVAADLQPGCRYNKVGGRWAGRRAGHRAGPIGPALRRAFNAGRALLVNVITDPEIAYPRATTGV